jgi:PE family
VREVFVSPGILESVAADVERIGAILTSGNAAAAGPARGVASSAADEVSTGIAVLF